MTMIAGRAAVRERSRLALRALLAALALGGSLGMANAQDRDWAATWTASQQGAFIAPGEMAVVAPVGDFRTEVFFPQPNSIRFALPEGTASDQSFRMIVRPDIWSDTVRIRLSNVFGTEPLQISSATVGLQEYAAHVLPGTIVPVTFDGAASVAIAPGERIFSDPVRLPFHAEDTADLLRGRKLAVSFAVAGTADSLSYHDAAEATSYISAPGTGDVAASESGGDYPFTTSSWFIVDAVDALAPEGTEVIVAFGDSITDGTLSTDDGDDRWPDYLGHRIDREFGDRVSVVIQAMSGNAVVTDVIGEPAVKRLKRDVLETSGVTSVIMMMGINDLGAGRNSPGPVIEGYKEIAHVLNNAGIHLVAATLTPGLRPIQDFSDATLGAEFGPFYGGPETNAYRQELNAFIQSTDIFDAVIDFEVVISDPATGVMKELYVEDSDGGPGDWLHPNRIGLQAMAESIDLEALGVGASN